MIVRSMDYKCCRARELLEAHGYTVLPPKRNNSAQNCSTPKALSRLSLGTVAYCDELEHAPYVRIVDDEKGEPIPIGSAIVGRCGLCGAELRLASNYSIYVSDKFAGTLCEKCGNGNLDEIYERVSKKYGDGCAELGR